MPLPSLYASEDTARAWSVARAAGYGAILGAVAAVFKMFSPWASVHSPAAMARESAGAVVAFALLCALAAALRNLIARRLIWPDAR